MQAGVFFSQARAKLLIKSAIAIAALRLGGALHPCGCHPSPRLFCNRDAPRLELLQRIIREHTTILLRSMMETRDAASKGGRKVRRARRGRAAAAK